VPLKSEAGPLTGKISSREPPPIDSEGYTGVKKTVKKFSSDIIFWKAGINGEVDPELFDDQGKLKRFQPTELEPVYSSFASDGIWRGSTKVLHPLGRVPQDVPEKQVKPSAHVVAQRATWRRAQMEKERS
ncbi:unnamed protein product, partial [Choristocarpus tenellus]